MTCCTPGVAAGEPKPFHRRSANKYQLVHGQGYSLDVARAWWPEHPTCILHGQLPGTASRGEWGTHDSEPSIGVGSLCRQLICWDL